ncbi:MAG TPA: hypothetical protein VMF29_08770 [Candidatus Edwardsbacteria bacterium]|nr:hypothetical protein [Candidatus Edwardsbacteria bacterium]
MKKIILLALLAVPVITAAAQQPAKPDSAKVVPPAAPGEIIIREAPAAPVAKVVHIIPAVTKPAPARKSIKQAFFMSLALPGAGECYVGAKRYTAGFLTAEGIILAFGGQAYFQYAVRRSDYRNLAAQQAGANYSRTNDEYYRDIYEYPSSDYYNEDQWRQAREAYPNDPQAQAAFVAGKLYGVADAWQWQSDNDWNDYRSLRVKSRQALQRIINAIPVLAVNHLLSAINAARLARSYNNRQLKKAAAIDWRLDLGRADGNVQLLLSGAF